MLSTQLRFTLICCFPAAEAGADGEPPSGDAQRDRARVAGERPERHRRVAAVDPEQGAGCDGRGAEPLPPRVAGHVLEEHG